MKPWEIERERMNGKGEGELAYSKEKSKEMVADKLK